MMFYFNLIRVFVLVCMFSNFINNSECMKPDCVTWYKRDIKNTDNTIILQKLEDKSLGLNDEGLKDGLNLFYRLRISYFAMALHSAFKIYKDVYRDYDQYFLETLDNFRFTLMDVNNRDLLKIFCRGTNGDVQGVLTEVLEYLIREGGNGLVKPVVKLAIKLIPQVIKEKDYLSDELMSRECYKLRISYLGCTLYSIFAEHDIITDFSSVFNRLGAALTDVKNKELLAEFCWGSNEMFQKALIAIFEDAFSEYKGDALYSNLECIVKSIAGTLDGSDPQPDMYKYSS